MDPVREDTMPGNYQGTAHNVYQATGDINIHNYHSIELSTEERLLIELLREKGKVRDTLRQLLVEKNNVSQTIKNSDNSHQAGRDNIVNNYYSLIPPMVEK